MACPPLLAAAATSIIIAGQPYDVGRPVVLWCDSDRGFDAYSETCVEKDAAASRCCRSRFKRYGARKGVHPGNLTDLRGVVRQLVLHHDGCVNSRSCFYSMHDTPRPDGGCGLSAHFMIDADGTIYQTLDVQERALHAGHANQISIGVEMCNRADASLNELDRLPADYRTRPVRNVTINGHPHEAFDFRPEQYASVTALTKVLVRALPQIEPRTPQQDGKTIMSTLADPMAFAGIVGHFHVDERQRKWDPGAFDWRFLLNALNGFYLPVPLRGYEQLPSDDQVRLAAAARAAFFNVEERTDGSFPVGPGGVWDPAVYSPAEPGGAVRAPARGVIMAARLGRANGATSPFVLIRHDLETSEGNVRFFTVLGPLLPVSADQAEAVGWLRELMRKGDREALTALRAGEVALLNQSVEAGEIVGKVASPYGSGASNAGQIRMEAFTTGPLPGAFRRVFRYLDASEDGPVCRRRAVYEAFDVARGSELDNKALEHFFGTASLDRRQALRRFAVRLPHPFGDRLTQEQYLATPAFAGLSKEERARVYAKVVAANVFWNDAVSTHAGLPRDQIVYFHHPITFLASLAAAKSGTWLRWPAASLVDSTLPADPESGRAALEWLGPRPAQMRGGLQFGPMVWPRFQVRRRDQIPLVVLPPIADR